MTSSTQQPQTYQQGHSRTVTTNHATRTATNEGAFILPHLKPYFKILDLGCGPGTITTGFAQLVPQGSVTGIDLTADVISQAEEHLSAQDPKPTNVTFKIANVLEGLPFPDGEFDVVFTSQVLVHIHDPVAALKEMRRVVKAGTGMVCAREGDWPFRYQPCTDGLQLFYRYFYQMIHGPVAKEALHPDQPPFAPGHRGGSLVHVWAREAGFDPKKVQKGGRMQIHSTEEERRFFGGIMAERIVGAGHGEKYVEFLRSLGCLSTDLMVLGSESWARVRKKCRKWLRLGRIGRMIRMGGMGSCTVRLFVGSSGCTCGGMDS
jgi:SAM-dependent methyltransferase